MHFVTQFTHVSRHFGVHNRQQNKSVQEKQFLKCGNIFVKKKWCMCPQNTYRKVYTKNTKKHTKAFTIIG